MIQVVRSTVYENGKQSIYYAFKECSGILYFSAFYPSTKISEFIRGCSFFPFGRVRNISSSDFIGIDSLLSILYKKNDALKNISHLQSDW